MNKLTTKSITHKEAVETLNKIIEWADGSHAYLSQRTEYARGYKEGIGTGKEIVLEIINSH